MDWTDIEAKLAERVEDVSRHLFPNGHREGNEWVVGSMAGEAGKSLKINLAGKVGMWRDFASDQGGKTLLSLWMHARQLPKFGMAVVEAKQFLGIADDFQKRVKAYPAPAAEHSDDSGWREVAEVWERCQPLTEGGPVWRYLMEKRKLTPAMIEAFNVREMLSNGRWTMVFPYFAVPSEETPLVPTAHNPEWLKFELLDRLDGRKREWTSKAPEKSLFGIQMAEHPMFAKCRHVLICEGEKDALSWAAYGCMDWGVLPLSVPFGAKWKGKGNGRPSPNREWLDRCWPWLQNFESVFVAMDSDEAGRRAAADIIAEIGPRRCRLVELPWKDAMKLLRFKDVNECLMACLAAEEMHYAIDHAVDFAPKKVVPAGDFQEEFMQEWFENLLEAGLALPWEFPFKIRPGELTIWTGIEKSGKTTLLGFVLMKLLAQGERALVASFEIKPVKTLKKFSRQALGGLIYDKTILKKCQNDDERAQYEAAARTKALETFKWLSKSLWIYDHVGIGCWRELGDDIRWARRRYGITQFVIDNFMRLGIAKDDYAQQADAIIYFTSLAMELGVHIHIVVHQNKSEGPKTLGGKRTVSGAFEIIANAHNIVEVQRYEKKGEQVSELYEELTTGKIGDKEFQERKAALDLKPDGKFTLHAQRDGETQNGSKYLWFLWQSQQYADRPPGHKHHAPICFVTEEKKKEEEETAKSDGLIDEEI